MKKLLCIALFSIAIMANAIETKETLTKTSEEKEVVVNNTIKKGVYDSDLQKETSVDAMFFGCASEGNGRYAIWREEGYSHREARALRRAYVRKCRNYFWQFGIF